MKKIVRVLLIGDVVGAPGRCMFQKHAVALKEKYACDAIIVNGENSANGRGITSKIMRFFTHNGANVVTSGNHIWHNSEIYPYLQQNNDLLRPANFPSGSPGTGVTVVTTLTGVTLAVMNLQGRIFMREHVDCPFRAADSLLTFLRTKATIILVDFHAEATSEKAALAYYLDGKVTAVVGTHTHVQTADERILPQGTAFISDLGMVGALHSMIGMQKEPIIRNFLTQMPQKFVVETKGPMVLSGVVISIDRESGKATAIERVRVVDTDIHVDGEL